MTEMMIIARLVLIRLCWPKRQHKTYPAGEYISPDYARRRRQAAQEFQSRCSTRFETVYDLTLSTRRG